MDKGTAGKVLVAALFAAFIIMLAVLLVGKFLEAWIDLWTIFALESEASRLCAEHGWPSYKVTSDLVQHCIRVVDGTEVIKPLTEIR